MKMKSILLLTTFFWILGQRTFAGHLEDSIGIIYKNQQAYILHKVEAGETLYSLARKYKVNVEAVKTANPHLVSAMKSGDLANVPIQRQAVDEKPEPVVETVIKGYKVQDGDNLYSIATKHGMTVEGLMKLNRLSSTFLDIGQVLLVEHKIGQTTTTQIGKQPKNAYMAHLPALQDGYARVVKVHVVQPDESPYVLCKKYGLKTATFFQNNGMDEKSKLYAAQKVVIEWEDIKGDPNAPAKVSELILNDSKFVTVSTDHVTGIDNTDYQGPTKAVTELGAAARIKNDLTEKKICLHDKAPVGSYIVVINQNTNAQSTVKVVGTLSDADREEKVIIKLSDGAWKELGDMNQRCPVKLLYNL